MSKLYRIIDESNNLCIALEMSRVEGSGNLLLAFKILLSSIIQYNKCI